MGTRFYSRLSLLGKLGTGPVNETGHRHGVLSVFDMFSIGIGPSSSHTVGPMKAARMFIDTMVKEGLPLNIISKVRVDLYGSLALTGDGHGTPIAILLGLEGERPELVNVSKVESRINDIYTKKYLKLFGQHEIEFNPREDLKMHKNKILPEHPNGLRFSLFDNLSNLIVGREYFSIGGGFIQPGDLFEGGNIHYSRNVKVPETERTKLDESPPNLPFYYNDASYLLELCRLENSSISQLVGKSEELIWQSPEKIQSQINLIWKVMDDSIQNGLYADDSKALPGGLNIKRRAPGLFRQLNEGKMLGLLKANRIIALDYLSSYAIAVSEENAAGGRVVTAPTNGAAGIIPAVLKYYIEFISEKSEQVIEKSIREFLFTAAAIGMLYKRGASISAAEVGCQGEVGVASSMAAGALTALLNGTPEQVENAAEIAMEHSLGLTCDPVGGLVQIPCIERNAIGAIKSVVAAQLALNGNGKHCISLDQVIKVMRQTGQDMQVKYKETSLGGLALNFTLC